MRNRDKLIDEVIFSEEKYLNTRIRSCLRQDFGFRKISASTATLGDLADLGKKHLNIIPGLGKKSKDAIIKTMKAYNVYFKKENIIFVRGGTQQNGLFALLKSRGMKVLNKCSAEYFEEGCKQMKIIEKCFQRYLDIINTLKGKDLKKFQRPYDLDVSSEELEKTYSEIVKKKREEFSKIEEERRAKNRCK